MTSWSPEGAHETQQAAVSQAKACEATTFEAVVQSRWQEIRDASLLASPRQWEGHNTRRFAVSGWAGFPF